MTKLVHYTVCFLLWLGRALSCPDDCFCTNVVFDTEVGLDADCSYASLSSLPTMPQDTLLLDISHNGLEVIPPSIKLLTNLRKLDLSNNRLGYDNDEGLPDDIFSTLVYLKVLDLSENYLSTLSSNTFKGLVQLERLDLSGNEIMHLPLGMLQLLPNTTVVCLEDNEWNCNMCQFHETLEWYLNADRNHLTNFCNREVPSCFSPSKRRFTEISLEEIPQCDEEKLITTSSTFISTPADLSPEPSTVTVDSLQSSSSANTHTSSTFISTPADLSPEPSTVTVDSLHSSASANTHTSSTFISTPADLSPDPSTVTVDSLHSSASANTHTSSTFISTPADLSPDPSTVTVDSLHSSASANTHTSSTFISTPADLSADLSPEPSTVTVDSLHSSASANTHTPTAHTTTTSPEVYSNSGKAGFQMRELGSWSWFLLIVAFLAPKMATRQTLKSSLLLLSS
ncbi:Leucine-rich repeat-containing protein 55 [Holothuria leucospilota]|uniref:Leucine-rich repeat-containing protein 55 n=1 Tax=Holothuria leucospilota TaxID=206669 RepID=A0A9Q1BYQ8_HOLLE|nr:Leucine-rich repeat-containing protein 55 [Holothuria leucospilota]